jgi:hypothetical protein
MSDPFISLLTGHRVFLAAKEAGAGALLSELVRRYRPKQDSVFLVDAASADFAKGLDLNVIPISIDGERAGVASMLAEANPDCVVVGASAGHSIEKIVLRLAIGAGLRTVSVVDHYWNPWQRFANETTAERWAYLPDRILVPHPLVAERLQKLGCPVEVGVFEHPLLSPPHREVNRSRSAVAREKLGIAADTIVMLLVSEYGFEDSPIWQWDQPPDAELLALALELFRFVANWQGQRPVHVLIRPHPSERRDWGALVPPDIFEKVTICGPLDKEWLFLATDIAFGLNSMLLAEAAAFGVPSYACYPTGRYRGPKITDYRPEIGLLPTGAAFPGALNAAVQAGVVRTNPAGNVAS